jgi:uncharacterized membrane protein (DUF441 family)
MLVRQQAQALLDARKVVVEGAVSIVTTAVSSLAQNGVKLTDKEQGRLVSNLLAGTTLSKNELTIYSNLL